MQYVNVNMDLFYIEELSYLDILIYSHVSNYHFSKKGRILFTKSKDTIANDFNVNIRSVFRSIANLKKYGFIETKVIKGKGKRTDVMQIIPIPIKKTKLYRYKYQNGSKVVSVYDLFDDEGKKVVDEMREKLQKR